MARDFTKVGVVGLGTIGAGIAEVFARNGLQVVGVEMDAQALEKGKARIEQSLQRAVDRGKMAADEQASVLKNISFSTDIGDFADRELVIEAVPEKIELKKQLFAELDKIVPEDAVLATNTSSLSVTDMAAATSHPKRVIGMHFFNPAPVQKLVEVIDTVITDHEVEEDVTALATRLGKTPVVVGDRAGFIVNELLFGYLNHAVSFFESKYASREDLDAAMMYGCGYPMGPLALMDLIGLDTAYEVLDRMYHEDRDKLHAPAPIIKHMITAGLLGRKSGRGFYTYEGVGSGKIVPDALTPKPRSSDEGLRKIEKIGVIGTGTMATGIIEVFAKAGFPVTYVGRGDDKVEGVKTAIGKSMDRAISRGRATEEQKADVVGQLTGTTNWDDLADVDIVVEAIAEDLDVKLDTFRRLDAICKPGAILATTTSSLPIIQCAAVTKRPEDVIGMHFFNPAQIMKLVEVVTTVATADDVTETVRALCKKVGKVDVLCGDRSGFIVNALRFPVLTDCVKMLEAHSATAADSDIAMKNGAALPMGPCELLDVVGLDVSLAIQRQLYMEFRDRGFAPAPLLEHMVTAGYLGRKTKRGFRRY